MSHRNLTAEDVEALIALTDEAVRANATADYDAVADCADLRDTYRAEVLAR